MCRTFVAFGLGLGCRGTFAEAEGQALVSSEELERPPPVLARRAAAVSLRDPNQLELELGGAGEPAAPCTTDGREAGVPDSGLFDGLVCGALAPVCGTPAPVCGAPAPDPAPTDAFAVVGPVGAVGFVDVKVVIAVRSRCIVTEDKGFDHKSTKKICSVLVKSNLLFAHKSQVYRSTVSVYMSVHADMSLRVNKTFIVMNQTITRSNSTKQ